MKLEWLESFVAFSESRNFTQAARELNITQPAFFRQIQSLAERLGIQLYRKEGRNLFLTDSGEHLARFARDVLGQIQTFEREFGQRESLPQIVLAAGQGTYLYLLGEALKDSGAQLRMLTTNREDTLASIRSGRAHLGVTVLDFPDEELECKLLLKYKPVLVVPLNHELADRKSIGVQKLADLPIIVPPEPSALRQLLTRALGEHNLTPKVTLEASGWELILHFVSLGLGVAVVNGCCRLPEGTRAIAIRDLPPTEYYLLHRREQFFNSHLLALKKSIIHRTSEIKPYE